MQLPDIYEFLRLHRYGVVSSVAGNGCPQSALVGIAITSEVEIIFDTLTTSRKYRNLVECPACSMVIGWSGEQTVQLEGIAERPSGPALTRVQEVYFSAWPECISHLAWPDIAYFVVHPGWIRYSDYQGHPAIIQEFSLSPRS